jgi:hypothetical protein
VLYDLIERVMIWGNQLPSFWPMMIGLVVLGYVTTLIHELGHGIAAALLTDRPIKIEVDLVGGLCRVGGGSSITVGAWMLIVAAGPAASWLQALVATWLTSMAAPGTFLHGVLGILAFCGYCAGIINLVPMRVDDMHTDGKQLVDLVRLAAFGRAPGWLLVQPPPPDPHAATSVAPPG